MRNSGGLLLGTFFLLIISVLWTAKEVNGQRHQTLGRGGGFGGRKEGFDNFESFEDFGSKGSRDSSFQGSNSKMYEQESFQKTISSSEHSKCKKGEKCFKQSGCRGNKCGQKPCKGGKCGHQPMPSPCQGSKCGHQPKPSPCQGSKCGGHQPKPSPCKGDKCGHKTCKKGEACDQTNIIIIEKRPPPPPPQPEKPKVIVKKDVQVINNNQKTIIHQNNNVEGDRINEINALILMLDRKKNECLQRFLALRRKALYYFNLSEELRQRAIAQAAERDRLLGEADAAYNIYLQLQEQARALRAQIRDLEGQLSQLTLEQQNILNQQDINARSVEADTAATRADTAAANRALIEAQVAREIAANTAALSANATEVASNLKRQALEAERDSQAAKAQADQFERQAKELLRAYKRLLMESNKQQKIAALQLARSQSFIDRAILQERLAAYLVGGLEGLNSSVRSGELRQVELTRSMQQLAALRDFALNDTNALRQQLEAIEDQQNNALRQYQNARSDARDQAIQVSRLTTLANILDNKAELTSDLARQALRCVITTQRDLFAIKNVYVWGKWWYVFRRFYPVCANRCAPVGQQYGFSSEEFLTCLRRCMCYNKGRYLSSMFNWDDQRFGEDYNTCYESQNWNERFAIFQEKYNQNSVEDSYMNVVLGPTLQTRGARLMSCDKNYWNYWYIWYLRFSPECRTQCQSIGATTGYNSTEYRDCMRSCLCAARCEQLGDIFNWTSTEGALCRDNCENTNLWEESNLYTILDQGFVDYTQQWWYIFQNQFPGNCTQYGVGTDEYRQCVRLGFCHNRCVNLGSKNGWTAAQITACEQQCNSDPYARALTRFGIERRNLYSFCRQTNTPQCPDLL